MRVRKFGQLILITISAPVLVVFLLFAMGIISVSHTVVVTKPPPTAVAEAFESGASDAEIIRLLEAEPRDARSPVGGCGSVLEYLLDTGQCDRFNSLLRARHVFYADRLIDVARKALYRCSEEQMLGFLEVEPYDDLEDYHTRIRVLFELRGFSP